MGVAAQLAELVRPGDRVVLSQGCAEPQSLCAALVEAHESVGPFETFVGPLFSTAFDNAPGMRFSSYGTMGRAARLALAGRLDVLPLHYSELCTAFTSGALRADVVLLQLARAPHGALTATLSNDYAVAAARHARTVVAEVNRQAPWSPGAALPHDLRLDMIIETDRAPLNLPTAPQGAAEAAIAQHVADLVPDGATVQTGIGALPDAILSALGGHRDLGVHSGLISDGVMDLIQRGAVTNTRKTMDVGVTVTNTVFGSPDLYRFVNGNEAVRLAPGVYTHSHAVLAAQSKLVAINSALEVDLGGNVNAERMDGAPIGGTGGLVDFMRGARASEGGLAITVLRASDRTGKISRIVPRTAAVTAAKTDTDVVVTEHGAARIRHLGGRERAEALIAIAPPAARDELWRALVDAAT